MTEESDVPPDERGDHSIPPPPQKADPFRLEAEPPQVMRLSRRSLAIGGTLAALASGGALAWALRPPAPPVPDELADTFAAGRPDVVTAAPADYAEVPRLGPPLPGDLGRPILAAQQEGTFVPVPPMTPVGPVDPARQALEDARALARGEADAARLSAMFQRSGTADAVPPAAPAAAAPGVPADAPRLTLPSSPRTLQAGSVIPAALLTGIRSDLPGQVTAQVTGDIHDSLTGTHLLVPQGSRLIGQYESEIAAGQTRVLLAWERLILPGGASIALGAMPGADAAGRAGLEDRVDNHWGRMIRAGLVSSLLGVGTGLAAGGESALVRALREGTQDSTGEIGRRVVERELAIAPTLTVRPGFAVRVIVTRDLVFEPGPAEPRP